MRIRRHWGEFELKQQDRHQNENQMYLVHDVLGLGVMVTASTGVMVTASTATSPAKPLPRTPLNRTRMAPEYTLVETCFCFQMLSLLLESQTLDKDVHDPVSAGDWISTDKDLMFDP
jgi:hypothetical protein